MLVIRMQRVGRSGHAQFRVVVQDSRQSPKSGKFVALLGSYNPHTKTAQLDKDKALQFVKNGAQPSERAARLLKQEGVKLPDWVKVDAKKSGNLRNPDKLRKNRPAEAEQPKTTEEPAVASDDNTEEAVAEEKAEDKAETTEVIAESEATADVEASKAEEKPDDTDEPVDKSDTEKSEAKA